MIVLPLRRFYIPRNFNFPSFRQFSKKMVSFWVYQLNSSHSSSILWFTFPRQPNWLQTKEIPNCRLCLPTGGLWSKVEMPSKRNFFLKISTRYVSYCHFKIEETKFYLCRLYRHLDSWAGLLFYPKKWTTIPNGSMCIIRFKLPCLVTTSMVWVIEI